MTQPVSSGTDQPQRPDIAQLIAQARRLGITMATAESCTGGMVAAALTDQPGSSAVFDRGFVTYSNSAKQAMLGVTPETLRHHGAVSEAVAREMSLGALQAAQVSLAVAITGIAGPGGSKPSNLARWGVTGFAPPAVPMRFGCCSAPFPKQSAI
jgi:nicotinamide-nucleotide amidase